MSVGRKQENQLKIIVTHKLLQTKDLKKEKETATTMEDNKKNFIEKYFKPALKSKLEEELEKQDQSKRTWVRINAAVSGYTLGLFAGTLCPEMAYNNSTAAIVAAIGTLNEKLERYAKPVTINNYLGTGAITGVSFKAGVITIDYLKQQMLR
jgi:hypothetical protein